MTSISCLKVEKLIGSNSLSRDNFQELVELRAFRNTQCLCDLQKTLQKDKLLFHLARKGKSVKGYVRFGIFMNPVFNVAFGFSNSLNISLSTSC